jgi:hypothetical protein
MVKPARYMASTSEGSGAHRRCGRMYTWQWPRGTELGLVSPGRAGAGQAAVLRLELLAKRALLAQLPNSTSTRSLSKARAHGHVGFGPFLRRPEGVGAVQGSGRCGPAGCCTNARFIRLTPRAVGNVVPEWRRLSEANVGVRKTSPPGFSLARRRLTWPGGSTCCGATSMPSMDTMMRHR